MLINERRRDVMARKVPSAIQVRLGGAKGVLYVNPLLEGSVIKLRKSMVKFDAPTHSFIEVATSSLHPLPTRLNRSLINALEDLDIEQEKFVALQRLAVQDIDLAPRSFKAASQVCRRYGFGAAFSSLGVFDKLHDLLGCTPEQLDKNGMINRLIATSMSAALGDLKRKARIPTLGRTLIGVVDEFGFLKKNEVFAQVEERDGSIRIIQGDVLIGRSPTIHPGDARMIKAVVPPKGHPLRHLRNVVVFSCEAEGRSLPSMLGGGDLDGDIYSLYEEPLLFTQRNASPGEYKQPANKKVNRPCTVDDLADFFTDYIINDQLGIVSHLHLHISDFSDLHSFDPDCKKLSSLHSQAVDFRKTGQPVQKKDLPSIPFGTMRPDFLAQMDASVDFVYKSRRALGYLFREIAWSYTDMPSGPNQLWVNKRPDGEVQVTIKSDFETILERLTKRYPYVKPPTDQDVLALGQRYVSLLRSFVYHISRIAAWVPEGRYAGEWLHEEEIILGSPVMATTSKLSRWQGKLKAATSELVPILKHQLSVISVGGDPVMILPSGKMDLDAQLAHRSFATVSGIDARHSGGVSQEPMQPVAITAGLLIDVEIDGEKHTITNDRQAAEGEVVLGEKKGRSAHIAEIQGLYSACVLGYKDPEARAFGSDTFALVALGLLLEIVDATEKAPNPLR